MIVKIINVDGRKRPDLPEGISFTRIREIDANTWEISAPEYEAEQERKALKKVAEIVIKDKFNVLTEQEKDILLALFEGADGEIKIKDGKLIKEDKPK